MLWSAHSGFASPPEIHKMLTHALPDRRIIVKRALGIILPDQPKPVFRPTPETENLHEHHKFAELNETFANLDANPPQSRGISIQASRLSPAHATAWHSHALAAVSGCHIIPAEEGDRL